MTPKATDNKRRPQLAEFERREKKTVGLNTAFPRVPEYEANNQARIAKIKRDFLPPNGSKHDRLQYLQKDDCR